MTDLPTIRAWLADPTAPLDKACGYVADLLSELDRLTSERATLLAPAEGVDVEEVLRLDSEATPAPWDADHAWWPGDDDEDEYAAVGPTHRLRKYDFRDLDTPEKRAGLDVAMMGIRADENLIAIYRTAAPALAREVMTLRARLAALERAP